MVGATSFGGGSGGSGNSQRRGRFVDEPSNSFGVGQAIPT